MESEKLCVFCVHLRYQSAGYGEYADPAELYCMKKHQLLCEVGDTFGHQSIYDMDDFRRMIKTAADCPDYSPASKYHAADCPRRSQYLRVAAN